MKFISAWSLLTPTFVVAGALGFAACGSGNVPPAKGSGGVDAGATTGSGGVDAGATVGTGGGGGDAGATTGTGGGDAGATMGTGGGDAGSGMIADAGSVNQGLVAVSYSPLANAGSYNLSTSLQASFLLSATVPKSCDPLTVDGCTVNVCPAPIPDAGTPVFVGAGPITVSGGKPYFGTSGPLVVMPTADHLYTSSTLESVTAGQEPGGLTLTISAAGDTVPAFSTQVTLPHDDLQVTSPPALATAAQGMMTLVRSSGLTVAWTGGAGGVIVVVTQLDTSGASVSIVCAAPAGSTSTVVSPAVLGYLATTSLLTEVGVGLASNTTQVTVPGWAIGVAGQAGGGPTVSASVQ